MTALPASTLATSSTATEADVKNFLTQQRDFLNGLLGATGLAADARTALGVSALTSSAVVAALGYTPANHANAATDHVHSYAPMTAVVSISNYVSSSNPPYCTATRANGATFTFTTGPFIDSGGS